MGKKRLTGALGNVVEACLSVGFHPEPISHDSACWDALLVMMSGLCRRLKVPVPAIPSPLGEEWLSDALSVRLEPILEGMEEEDESSDAFFGALAMVAGQVEGEYGT